MKVSLESVFIGTRLVLAQVQILQLVLTGCGRTCPLSSRQCGRFPARRCSSIYLHSYRRPQWHASWANTGHCVSFVVFLRRCVYPCPPCVPPSHVDAVVAYLQTVDEALPPPLSHSPPQASVIALSPSVLFTFAIGDNVSRRLNQSSSCAT